MRWRQLLRFRQFGAYILAAPRRLQSRSQPVAELRIAALRAECPFVKVRSQVRVHCTYGTAGWYVLHTRICELRFPIDTGEFF